MSAEVGIIGFGEAGQAVAAGLRGEGVDVVAFDTRAESADLRQRARELGVPLLTSLEDLASTAPNILCMTSAKTAVAVAREVADHLASGHLYADWNSVAPAVMRQVADIVSPTGAGFVDGAIMAAVAPYRHQVPVLVSGPGATAFAERARSWGMRVEALGVTPGQASAVKMFRGILVKGIEALLIEFVLGAAEFDASERALRSLAGTLPFDDWEELADYLMTRTVQHADRRAEELRQAGAALREAGVEPRVVSAAAARLQWFAELDLRSVLGSPPYRRQDIVTAVRDVTTGPGG